VTPVTSSLYGSDPDHVLGDCGEVLARLIATAPSRSEGATWTGQQANKRTRRKCLAIPKDSAKNNPLKHLTNRAALSSWRQLSGALHNFGAFAAGVFCLAQPRRPREHRRGLSPLLWLPAEAAVSERGSLLSQLELSCDRIITS
jgi:hypothetical protein